MFETVLPALLALCYAPGLARAVQLSPYNSGLGHYQTTSYTFGPDDIHKPLGFGGFKEQVLEYGPPGNSFGYGPGRLGATGYGVVHEGYLGQGALGIGPGVGYGGYGSGLGGGNHFVPVHPGFPPHGHGFGGANVDQSSYSGAKNSLAGQHHSSSSGQQGASSDHGDAGFRSGQVAEKDVRGQSVRFTDVDGVNNGRHEAKTYLGGEHFDKEGKHGGENVLKENHKKGHNIKSFKKSHHLDETGQTEEYYDEDHDEGGNFNFKGESGKFGENSANSFKGGFNDGKFTSGESKKEGHFGNEYAVDKVDGEHGKFGGSKFARDQNSFGYDRGVGEHGSGGHLQSSAFFKKSPHF